MLENAQPHPRLASGCAPLSSGEGGRSYFFNSLLAHPVHKGQNQVKRCFRLMAIWGSDQGCAIKRTSAVFDGFLVKRLAFKSAG